MRFLKQDIVSDEEARRIRGFDVAFHGREDIDQRSRHSADLSKAAARQHVSVRYDPKARSLEFGDGSSLRVDELDGVLGRFRARSVLLDATTLEFPELLFLLTAYGMQESRPRCGFFYVEPEGYKAREPGASIVPGNAYDLSEEFLVSGPLPGFGQLLTETSRAHLIAFLGFEGERLTRVLDDDDGHFFGKVSVVFGVPPFQPSWDLQALMANTSLLERPNTNVLYCGANNPLASYELLKDMHAGLPTGPVSRLTMAPFGTKPMAVGAALYCLDHRIVSPIYDHPVRKVDRSFGVYRRHWYEVDISL